VSARDVGDDELNLRRAAEVVRPRRDVVTLEGWREALGREGLGEVLSSVALVDGGDVGVAGQQWAPRETSRQRVEPQQPRRLPARDDELGYDAADRSQQSAENVGLLVGELNHEVKAGLRTWRQRKSACSCPRIR
jgi:hypothetical protein